MPDDQRRPVLLIDRATVERLLSPADCIDALEEAFGTASKVQTFVGGVVPAGGKIHVKAAMAGAPRTLFAAKINANFPENPTRHGLPTIQGLLVLVDAAVGVPVAVMDSMSVTLLRTAAATAVAARRLAAEDADTVAVIGCGAQALSQIEALRVVRPIRRVVAYDQDADNTRRFVADVERVGLEATGRDSVSDAVRGAPIVVTCTTSRSPVLGSSDVGDRCFIAAVGADSPDKSEIAPDLMARAAVVVDDVEQCATFGDLHHALTAGAMQRSDVRATLLDVVRRPDEYETLRDGLTVFDSTGIPIEDVAAAARIFARAEEDKAVGTFVFA
jgi:ornithine cyclodeaminase/alanine dehydrogenase